MYACVIYRRRNKHMQMHANYDTREEKGAKKKTRRKFTLNIRQQGICCLMPIEKKEAKEIE